MAPSSEIVYKGDTNSGVALFVWLFPGLAVKAVGSVGPVGLIPDFFLFDSVLCSKE